MRIIISPAKKMNSDTDSLPWKDFPAFLPDTERILHKLREMSYPELKKLLSEQHYDIVHTHTPNASAIVRLACRPLRKQGIKVFYTAHGFHFYDGAPKKNWIIYYPIEKFFSKWTDIL